MYWAVGPNYSPNITTIFPLYNWAQKWALHFRQTHSNRYSVIILISRLFSEKIQLYHVMFCCIHVMSTLQLIHHYLFDIRCKINPVNYEQEFVGGFDGPDISDRKPTVSNMVSIVSNNLDNSCFVSYISMEKWTWNNLNHNENEVHEVHSYKKG